MACGLMTTWSRLMKLSSVDDAGSRIGSPNHKTVMKNSMSWIISSSIDGHNFFPFPIFIILDAYWKELPLGRTLQERDHVLFRRAQECNIHLYSGTYRKLVVYWSSYKYSMDRRIRSPPIRWYGRVARKVGCGNLRTYPLIRFTIPFK